MSSDFEGDIIQFKPLDGSEFHILVHKVFYNCDDCGLFEGSLVIWPTNHLFNLNDIILDVVTLSPCVMEEFVSQ